MTALRERSWLEDATWENPSLITATVALYYMSFLFGHTHLWFPWSDMMTFDGPEASVESQIFMPRPSSACRLRRPN